MRKLATWCYAFAAGIFLAQYLLKPAWLPAASACALCLGFAALLLPEPRRYRVVLACTALCVALGYDWFYVRWFQAPAEALAGTEQAACAVLQDDPAATDYGARATVLLTVPGNRPIRAVYYGGEELLELLPGDTVRGEMRLKSAARLRDQEVSTFTSHGVFLLAYGGEGMESEAGASGAPRYLPARLKRALCGQVNWLYSGDTAGFLTAILTGDKSGLSDGAEDALSEAGLYHILAVSGMHCGFLLALLRCLLGRRKRLLAAVGIPALALYALTVGARPSVVRACVMLSLLLIAPLFRRESDPPTAMAVALAGILIQNPFAAGSIGLQLSFAAVAGLLWLTPKLSRLLTGEKERSRLSRFLIAGFSATMGALVFTVPLTGWYFGTLGLLSPVSNLLCLGAAGAVFVTGFLSALLGFVCPPLAAVLGWIPRILTAYLLAAARVLARLPFHAVYFTSPFLALWLGFAYLLFFIAWRGGGGRRKYAVALACAVLTLAAALKLGAAYRTRGALNIAVVDVGQGQSIVLESEGHYAVLDCGSANRWKDAGADAAEELAAMGCGRVDCLVLTHYDFDHVSGVERLMGRVPVETLLVPRMEDDAGLQGQVLASAREHGAAVRFVTEPERLTLGRAELALYPPVGGGGDNERGLAVLCREGGFALLATGDMKQSTERALLEAYPLPDIEVLIAGHHGSKYASSEELLAAVQPELAVVSVGENSYGHPADEALRRLAWAGARVCRTDRQGTVRITVK